MITVTHNTGSRRWDVAALRRVAGDLAAWFAAVIVMAAVIQWLLGLSGAYIAQSAGLYTLVAVLVIVCGPGDLPGRGLSSASFR